ncbi:hypothetical protein Y543_03995 [Listeria monocytogenes]|nr:hypothetical protein [Listeria monocytogenes]EAD2561996.1 hypothetical protein [Listeria monocytogenes]OFH60103.1 hypothetical protein BJM99_11170 [Listeria monocytogenes]
MKRKIKNKGVVFIDSTKKEANLLEKHDRNIELLRNIDENILTSKQKNLYNEYLEINQDYAQ